MSDSKRGRRNALGGQNPPRPVTPTPTGPTTTTTTTSPPPVQPISPPRPAISPQVTPPPRWQAAARGTAPNAPLGKFGARPQPTPTRPTYPIGNNVSQTEDGEDGDTLVEARSEHQSELEPSEGESEHEKSGRESEHGKSDASDSQADSASATSPATRDDTGSDLEASVSTASLAPTGSADTSAEDASQPEGADDEEGDTALEENGDVSDSKADAGGLAPATRPKLSDKLPGFAAPTKTATQPIIAPTGAQPDGSGGVASPNQPPPRSVREQRGPLQKRDNQVFAARLARVWGLDLPSRQQQQRKDGLATAAFIIGEPSFTDPDREEAKRLQGVIVGLGMKALPPNEAMDVTAAKIQLDLMSQKRDRRLSLAVSGKGQGVNDARVIRTKGADGLTRAAVCKPVSTSGEQPSGGPVGGEVVREAISGRAAQAMLRQGIDVGMPDTQVIKLPAKLISGADADPDVTCSVQQWAKDAKGDIAGTTPADLAKLHVDQVAPVAVFDIMTLANDRHRANLLISTDDELVPIDHGGNFTEVANEDARKRLGISLGGCNNAILAIPAAHDPLPGKVQATLQKFNPEVFAETLRADRDEVAARHPDMVGAISDAAIDASRRAAEFTKLAVDPALQPPLSAAAIQVALGGNAAVLLDPTLSDDDFEAKAKAILATVSKQQDAIKTVSLASNTEYEMLLQDIEARGDWKLQRRNDTTNPRLIGDPVTLLAIEVGKLGSKPKITMNMPDHLKLNGRREDQLSDQDRAARKAVIDQAQQPLKDWEDKFEKAKQFVSADTKQILTDIRTKALSRLVTLLSKDNKQAYKARLFAEIKDPDKRSALLEDLQNVVLSEQAAILDDYDKAADLEYIQASGLPSSTAVPGPYLDSRNEVDAKNPLRAAAQTEALQGRYPLDQLQKTVITDMMRNFDPLNGAAKLGDNDPIIVALRAAVQADNCKAVADQFLLLYQKAQPAKQ